VAGRYWLGVRGAEFADAARNRAARRLPDPRCVLPRPCACVRVCRLPARAASLSVPVSGAWACPVGCLLALVPAAQQRANEAAGATAVAPAAPLEANGACGCAERGTQGRASGSRAPESESRRAPRFARRCPSRLTHPTRPGRAPFRRRCGRCKEEALALK